METLLSQVALELESRGYTTTVHDVQKVNATKKGLSIVPTESNISPTFYEDHFEQMRKDGLSVQEIADKIVSFSEHGAPELGDYANNLKDKDYLMEHASFCVCNRDWNRAFLEQTPYKVIEGTDLAGYVRIKVGEDGSMVPTHTHLSMANMDEEELIQAAQKNSSKHYTIRTMESVLLEMAGGEPVQTESSSGMYIISNDTSQYGASAIADENVLNEVSERLGGDCYIIPSGENGE